MQQHHTTTDGKTMMIAEMESDHLLNTIGAYCRKIKICREVLENPSGYKGDVVLQALNPGYSPEACTTRAKEVLADLHDRLQSYLFEAALRGLNITETLQATYGRKEAIPNQTSLAMRLFFNRSLTD